nr:hypothetical protein GCM10020241_35680 [Streptoalloteichus tenebrarius]
MLTLCGIACSRTTCVWSALGTICVLSADTGGWAGAAAGTGGIIAVVSFAPSSPGWSALGTGGGVNVLACAAALRTSSRRRRCSSGVIWPAASACSSCRSSSCQANPGSPFPSPRGDAAMAYTDRMGVWIATHVVTCDKIVTDSAGNERDGPQCFTEKWSSGDHPR